MGELETTQREAAVPSPATTQQAHAKRAGNDRFARQPHAAGSALDVAARILHDGDATSIRAPLQTQDIVALWELHAAATQMQRGKPIGAVAALALLDNSMPTLMQARDSYLDDGSPDARVWVEERVLGPLAALRARLTFLVASNRVDQAVLVDGRVFDVGDGAPVKEQEAGLRAVIGKLVPALAKVNELASLAHEPEMEEELEHQLAGHLPKTKYGSVLDLVNALNVMDGLLTLSDPELRERMAHMHGWEAIQTAAELVKATTELVAGCTGLTLALVGKFAQLAGETEVAQVAIGAGRFVAAKVGSLLAVVELAVELTAAIGARTTEERVSHGVNAAAGVGLIAAKKGATVFGASTIALQLSYTEARAAATLYWEGAQGIVQALMTPAFEELQRDANAIATSVERVIKARALLDAEQDAARRETFESVLARRASECGEYIDGLIADISAPKLEADMAVHPGSYKIFADALAPVRAYAGGRSPETVMTAASVALSKLTWIFANAKEILFAATTHGGVRDVERLAAARSKKPKEKVE